jgi:hypothetical protein
MSIPAPRARLVDALSGDVAPTAYFKALSEADSLCAELDTLRELQTRNQELAAENADLAERLRDLDESHRITLSRLAVADAQLKRMQATR